MARTPDDLTLEGAMYRRPPAGPGPALPPEERLVSPPPSQESPLEEVGEVALSPGRGGEASDNSVVARVAHLAQLGDGRVFRSALEDSDIHRLARLPEQAFAEIAASGVLDSEVVGDVEDFRPDAIRMGPPLAPMGSHLGLGPEDSLINYDVLLGRREDALRAGRQIRERMENLDEGTEEFAALEAELSGAISRIVDVGRKISVTESLFRKNPQIAMVNSRQRISALDMLSESLEE